MGVFDYRTCSPPRTTNNLIKVKYVILAKLIFIPVSQPTVQPPKVKIFAILKCFYEYCTPSTYKQQPLKKFKSSSHNNHSPPKAVKKFKSSCHNQQLPSLKHFNHCSGLDKYLIILLERK